MDNLTSSALLSFGLVLVGSILTLLAAANVGGHISILIDSKLTRFLIGGIGAFLLVLGIIGVVRELFLSPIEPPTVAQTLQENQEQNIFPTTVADTSLTPPPLPTAQQNLSAPMAESSAAPPQPTETPSDILPTSAATQEVTSGLFDCGKFEIGEKRRVSSGTFVIGDVVIDGVPQYDMGGTSEGTVAYFEEGGEVIAEWGAGCYLASKDFLDEIVEGEFEHGCNSGCSTVRVVIVNADGQQAEFRSP